MRRAWRPPVRSPGGRGTTVCTSRRSRRRSWRGRPAARSPGTASCAPSGGRSWRRRTSSTARRRTRPPRPGPGTIGLRRQVDEQRAAATMRARRWVRPRHDGRVALPSGTSRPADGQRRSRRAGSFRSRRLLGDTRRHRGPERRSSTARSREGSPRAGDPPLPDRYAGGPCGRRPQRVWAPPCTTSCRSCGCSATGRASATSPTTPPGTTPPTSSTSPIATWTSRCPISGSSRPTAFGTWLGEQPERPARRHRVLAVRPGARHGPSRRRGRRARRRDRLRRATARARVRHPRPAHPPGRRRPVPDRGDPPRPDRQVLLPPSGRGELGRRRPSAALAARLAGPRARRPAGPRRHPRGADHHHPLPDRAARRAGRAGVEPLRAAGQLLAHVVRARRATAGCASIATPGRSPWRRRTPPSRTSRMPPSPRAEQRLDVDLLRSWPLPADDSTTSAVGARSSSIGGSDRTPGAVLLAGIAALRSGAGRLQIATAHRRSPPPSPSPSPRRSWRRSTTTGDRRSSIWSATPTPSWSAPG